MSVTQRAVGVCSSRAGLQSFSEQLLSKRGGPGEMELPGGLLVHIWGLIKILTKRGACQTAVSLNQFLGFFLKKAFIFKVNLF